MLQSPARDLSVENVEVIIELPDGGLVIMG
jgi:hypothetical protein